MNESMMASASSCFDDGKQMIRLSEKTPDPMMLDIVSDGPRFSVLNAVSGPSLTLRVMILRNPQFLCGFWLQAFFDALQIPPCPFGRLRPNKRSQTGKIKTAREFCDAFFCDSLEMDRIELYEFS